MRTVTRLLMTMVLGWCVSLAAAAEPDAVYLAGATKAVITPREPMYLSGFANRVVPAEGMSLDLHAKALALVDRRANTRLVLVTLDLIEVPIQLRELLAQHLADKHQLPAASLLLNCSHTHCGPELRFAEQDLATLAPERAAMCRRYNQFLTDTLKKLIDDALASAAPANLSYGHARCGFAMNRRLKNDVAGGEPYLNRPNPDGVVDHDVPVLKVESTTGKLTAVMFGYACHNTTLNLKQFHADYAGYAQQALEAAHPDTVALFMMGCGGDQNGYPRMKIPYSEQHGRSLATAVEAALEAKSRPLTGPLKLAYGTVPLDFQPAPSAERLKARLATGAEYPVEGRAYFEDWDRRRLAELERGTLLRQYPFPAQVIRFGDELTFIALAGETVVDYSLRLKRELQGSAVWIAGYSNDVFAYVPSKRVLLEGGYEAERAMIYMTHPVMPGPFEPNVEEKVIGKVRELLAATATTKHNTPAQSPTLVPHLTRAEAIDGWIALFDGHTTFGFRDAQVTVTGTTTALRGGSTTTEFSDFGLRIKATSGGTITLGDKTEALKPGWNALESRGSRTTIKLGNDVAAEAILLKPLASKALFNGKNLAGWDLRAPGHSTSKRPPEWNVENGMIRVRGGPGAMEYAPRDGQNLFGDMLVQVIACTRIDDCNGGFFFRNEPGKTMMGYEAQLHHKWYDPASGAHGYTTGGIDDRQQARRAVAMDHEPFIMTVVAHGPHLATWVNGYQVTDWVDTRAAHANPRNGLRLEPGTLQLQAHDPETDLEFHQVRVQELTPASRK